MDSGFSPADFAAVSRNDGSGWGGDGGWMALIILFALIGNGGFGWGGNRGGEPVTESNQKILDAITGNRMADMQNQINQLQLQAALCGVVRWPQQATWNGGQVPFFGNCGCNTGCCNI